MLHLQNPELWLPCSNVKMEKGAIPAWCQKGDVHVNLEGEEAEWLQDAHANYMVAWNQLEQDPENKKYYHVLRPMIAWKAIRTGPKMTREEREKQEQQKQAQLNHYQTEEELLKAFRASHQKTLTNKSQ